MPRPVPLRTVHCGPCWAEFGGSPDAGDIAAPPPEALGSRDPRDQREWPARLAAEPWVEQLRRDCRDKLLRMVRELALSADWHSWESWPGWDRLMEKSGWARSTLAGWLRQLRLLGWVSVIESGSTPQFRPLALADVEGNRRAVYALRVPRRPGEQRVDEPPVSPEQAVPPLETVVPNSDLEARARAAWRWFATGFGNRSDQGGCRVVDKTWTPTWFFDLSSSVGKGVSSRATEFFHSSQVTTGSEAQFEALRARFDEKWAGFSSRVPTTGAQMLAAAAELRHQHPVLARLAIRAVRAVCRPYWRAGWHNDDVLHALEFRPTSWSTLPAMDPARVVAPYRWAQSRLGAWRTNTGRVLPGHSQSEHERRTRQHAVMARHGWRALAALPAGAGQLRAVDVRRFGREQVDAAVELLRRRRAAELVDAWDARRAADQVAGVETVRKATDWFRADRARRRGDQDALRARLVAQARAAAAKQDVGVDEQQAVPELARPVRWTPPGPAETSGDAYERARAAARAEGRLPLSRRRRRPRW